MIPFVGSESVSEFNVISTVSEGKANKTQAQRPNISGTSHWIVPRVGIRKELNTLHQSQCIGPYRQQPGAILPPQGNHPTNTHGILGWRDTQDGARRAIGAFSSRTEWNRIAKEDRPPAVSLVANCPRDGRPPYFGIVVKFQLKQEHQLRFCKQLQFPGQFQIIVTGDYLV